MQHFNTQNVEMLKTNIMTNTVLLDEEKNKKKGLRISVTLHILLLLLALYPILRDDPEQNIDKQYAVAITFSQELPSNSFKGKAAEGRQRPRNMKIDRVKPAPVKNIEKNNTAVKVSKPKVHVPQPQKPQAPAQSDIFEDESDVFAVEEVPQEQETKIENVPESPPEKVTPAEPANDVDEVEDVPAQVPSSAGGRVSDTGTNTSSPSNKNGSGTGQGKKGKGHGKDKSGNDSTSGIGTGGPGTGAFDGSGNNSIFGRYIFKRPPMKELELGQTGRIKFKVCIDRKGNSTFVDIIKRGTTIHDKKILQKALDYMARCKWEQDDGAASEQCGHFTLIIEKNN